MVTPEDRSVSNLVTLWLKTNLKILFFFFIIESQLITCLFVLNLWNLIIRDVIRQVLVRHQLSALKSVNFDDA